MAAKNKSVFREYAEAIVVAAILALFIRTFVVQAFKIPSGSMKETLLVGDHLLVNKFLYGTHIPFTNIILMPIRDPKRGDIIVFKYPEDESKDFIKRVIGTPGDVVQESPRRYISTASPYRSHTPYIAMTRSCRRAWARRITSGRFLCRPANIS